MLPDIRIGASWPAAGYVQPEQVLRGFIACQKEAEREYPEHPDCPDGDMRLVHAAC